jgi:hypothetical protein
MSAANDLDGIAAVRAALKKCCRVLYVLPTGGGSDTGGGENAP